MNSPNPPNPQKTASIQAQYNLATAAAQQGMNMVNQVGPHGSVTYDPSGKFYTYVDPATGKTVQLPLYTEFTTLSPEEQKLQQQQWAFGEGSNALGLQQLGQLKDVLSHPVTGDTGEIESYLANLYNQRIEPQFQRDRADLETKLANQGITQGSEAWNRAIDALGRQQNDARVQTMLTGHQQALEQLFAIPNNQVNQITALMSGGQVTPQQFGPVPQTGVAIPDYANMRNAAYQGQLAGYQANMGALGAGLGALGAAGGAYFGGRGF